MRITSIILAALVILTSCSDQKIGGGTEASDTGGVYALDADIALADTGLLDTGLPDAPGDTGPVYTGPCSTNQCCQTQYWYCPESFQGDELWRIEVIVDICDDEGVP